MSPSPDQTQPQNPASQRETPPMNPHEQLVKQECKGEVLSSDAEHVDVKDTLHAFAQLLYLLNCFI